MIGTTQEIRNLSVAALAFGTLACVVIFTATLVRVSERAEAALDEVRGTVAQVNGYVTRQTNALETERNRKAIEAGIAAAASVQASVRLLNTTTIPRLNTALETLNNSLNQVDTGVLPQTVRFTAALADGAENLNLTAQKLQTTPAAIEAALQTIAARSGVAMDELSALIADPAWKGVIRNLEATTAETAQTMRHVNATAGYVEEAAAQAPAIAQSLEKLARTSSRYSKALILAQILSLLVRAF